MLVLPGFIQKITEIFEISYSKPGLPPLEEFKKGCEKYQEEEYEKRD